MVLIRGLHLTALENLPSILDTGLEPRVPIEHNYRDSKDLRPWMERQPKGVYISFVHDEASFYRPGDGIGNWFYDPEGHQQWEDADNAHVLVHYCGPMIQDPLMGGCAAFTEVVPPSALFLCYGDPQVAYPDRLMVNYA